MTDLSPAAQAVLDAAFPIYDDETLDVATGEQHTGLIAAAALCAVADEVAPFEAMDIDNCWYEKRNPVREKILAIATELKNHK